METVLYQPIPEILQGEGILPIPPLQSNYLPKGIYDCTIEEIKDRFGTNEMRTELIGNLSDYVGEIQKIGIRGWIIVNGSFVTSKDEPGDIDMILVVEDQSMLAPMNSQIRAIISQGYVKDKFKLHLFIAFPGDKTEEKLTNMFSGVREDPNTKKGLLKVEV